MLKFVGILHILSEIQPNISSIQSGIMVDDGNSCRGLTAQCARRNVTFRDNC